MRNRPIHWAVAFSIVLLGAVAPLAAAPIVANGDFSANANQFVVWPGYTDLPTASGVGTNPTSLTGWTSGAGTGHVGINGQSTPIATGSVDPGGAGIGGRSTPFTDNGNTPPAVAFIQGANSLSQDISGFNPGSAYAVTLNYNSRTGASPTYAVSIGGVTQTLANVQSVGGGNPYYSVTVPFVATGSTQTLQLQTSNTTGNAPGADYTTLFANVAVKPVSIVPVVNPSFEASGSPSVWPGYARDNAGLLAGWQTTGSGVGINAANNGSPSSPFAPSISQNGLNIPDGSHFAFIQDDGSTTTSPTNPNFATLSQVIHGLTPGDNYTLNFFTSERAGNTNGISLAVYMGSGLSIDSSGAVTGGSALGNFNPSNVQWTPESLSFTATSANETLIFQTINTLASSMTVTSDLTLNIDGVSILGPPAPEPSTLFLGALSAAGLFLVARRRRKA